MDEADRAIAARDLARARQLLEELANRKPEDPDFWRKLATLRRMGGDFDEALAAIDAALVQAPLDFVSLLVRAGILDQKRDAAAGEAYGRALAQRPADALPAMLHRAVERAEIVYQEHQRALEAKLQTVAQGLHSSLISVERSRAERFISNISRRTRIFHSEPTHFHYPHLLESEFHERAKFPWLDEWEAATDVIEAEFAALLDAESAELVPYVQYSMSEPLSQWRDLNHSLKWTSIHLLQRGQLVESNARHCPQTMALLSRFPQPRIAGCGANAMFSLLAPNTQIPPHVGVANFRLVCHLPLRVPEKCWFRVGETTREWRRGEAWVFDDTIEHEAANGSDELRVIMIIDCWHPDLSLAERAAITAIVGESSIQETNL